MCNKNIVVERELTHEDVHGPCEPCLAGIQDLIDCHCSKVVKTVTESYTPEEWAAMEDKHLLYA